MADKHPQFRSDAERKKWSSLQNKAGHSLHQISQGKATPADLKNIDKTLAGLSKLAKSVFSDAVKAAEAQVAAVQKTNLKQSKESQEQFAQSVGEVLKDKMPEILAQIKDIIELESLDQDDRFEKTISSQLESFASFLPPRDIPTTDDVVAIHEATIEQQSSADDRKWGARHKGLVLDIADALKSTILSMAKGVVRPSNAPRLAGPAGNNWEVVDGPRSVAKHGLSMLSGHRGGVSDVTDVGHGTSLALSSGIRQSTSDAVVSTPGAGGATLSLSKVAEQAIIAASNAQTRLHSEIRDLLQGVTKGGGNGGGGGGGGGGGAADDADDTKRADAWWRSFGKWIGPKYESAKEKLETAKSWLSTIGAGLLSVLMAPGLYETIATKAKELLTWENIKSAASEAWNYMYEKGKSVIDWVSDKLGLSGVVDKVGGMLTEGITYLRNAVEWILGKLGFKGAPKGPAPASKPVPKHDANAPGTTTGGPGKPSVAAPSALVGGGEGATTPAPSVLAGSTKTVGQGAPTGASTPAPGGAPVSTRTPTTASAPGGNRSTISPSILVNARPGTTSAPATTVKTTPPVTTPVAGSTSATATNARQAPPSQSTSTVGLDSFGINSGVDDSLALMNLGVIAG